MDRHADIWREADFGDIEGVLVVGNEVYFTARALAKRVGLDEETVRDRIRRKRIPSVPGLADGERLVPLTALRAELERRAEPDLRAEGTAFETHDAITPDVQAVAHVFQKRRKKRG